MLQETQLIVGKYYRVKFNTIWKDFGNYDITINGITSLSNSEEYSDFDIRGTFFEPINLGISDYITHVNADTEIYICTIIEQKDPIKLEKNTILIPKSMIDFSYTEEFIIVEKVQVTIDGITKYFTNSLEKANYLSELTKQLRSKVKGIEHYGGIPINTSTTNQDYLMLKSNYEEFEQARQDLFDKTKAAMLLHSKETEAEWGYAYLKQKEVLTKIAYYEEQNGLIDLKLASAIETHNETLAEAEILNQIRLIIIDLLQDIRDAGHTITSYQDLYDQAKANL